MLCNKKRKCSKVLHIVTRKNLQIYLNIVFISSTFTKKIGLGDASLASFNLIIPIRESYFAANTYLSASRGAASRHKQWSVPAVTWGHWPTDLRRVFKRLPPTQRSNSTSTRVNAEAPVNKWGIYCSWTGSSSQIHLSQHVDCVFNETIRRVILHQR